MKIVELLIDDEFEESGIEAISLVSSPAHEENWIAFNNEKPESITYKVVSDDFCDTNPLLDTLGEPYNQLIDEGWVITRVEQMTPENILKLSRERFSDPNAESEEDTVQFRIRFKYVGPRDTKNRKFCSDMLSKNRVYRMEDIEQLSNNEFGNYDIFTWRGSFNCRHTWVKLIYQPEGKIRNSGDSTRGLIDTEGLSDRLQPDTRTEATIQAVEEGRGQGQWKRGMPRNGSNLFMSDDGTEVVDKDTMIFSVANEDKKIIIGAAMVPNKMIHRYDMFGNKYYVYFSKESIRKMANRFLKQKRTDETSIEHNGIKLGSDKVYITESWISEDPIKDKSNLYGFELPEGTWFVQMKVEDPKVWELVKKNTLSGFSVEGLFMEKSVFSKEEKTINQIK